MWGKSKTRRYFDTTDRKYPHNYPHEGDRSDVTPTSIIHPNAPMTSAKFTVAAAPGVQSNPRELGLGYIDCQVKSCLFR